jgi:hypothetical protein
VIPRTELRIYAKTAKGTAELAVRSGALSLAQRRLLILVDGIRDAGEIGAILPEGFDAALQVLDDGGYIEPAGQSTRTVAPAGGTVPDSQLTTVEEARQRAAAAARRLLGTAADWLAAAMEAAPSGDDLRPLVREAERLIAEAHGDVAAQIYVLAIRRR